MDINYLAVLVAAVAGMVVGFMWFGPLFGKTWIKLMGFSDEDMKKAQEKGMGKTYVISFLASLVTAYVLARFADLLGLTSFAGALSLAFWAWLGFIATTMINSVLWEGRPAKLYFINIAHQLVTLAVMASIIALW